ncbi:MAG TPA: hypothetical protein VK724_00635 [Bryobacteraceae bacterium]|jgi:hypothetical protein|nr:hypothetical protein [Bryobacteraceae bacterium]
MVEQEDVQQMQAPSKKAIAKATGIALAVALLLLFTAVLPAEYGIDPLKTGKALHLTDLAKATESKAESKPAVGARPVAAPAGIYTAQPGIFKTDSEDLSLMPGEGVEIKYHMQKGAGMLYSWKATGPVAFEFHGEPDNKPNKDYFESYELNDKAGADHANGSFTAPSTGIHGWFWENKGKKEVEIHLVTTGFYDNAKMMAGDEKVDLTIQDAK